MGARPILRYHGGKWKLAPWIIANLPNHRVYVEPYGGAASVLLRKPRSYAEIYNDLDGEIVNLFRVAREAGPALRRLVQLTPYARAEFDLSYQVADDPLEQARRTLVRAFMGFASNAHHQRTGFRANSTRPTAIPAHDWMRYPDALDGIIARLQGVVIEKRHAFEVMQAHDGPHTVHYVDPPYVSGSRDAGTDYRHEMSDSDHRDLAHFLRTLQGMVVLSGYASDLYGDLYGHWRCLARRAYADGARQRTERLWLSPACPRADLFDDGEDSGAAAVELVIDEE